MFGSGTRYRILTVRGIPLFVERSWLFVAAFYTWIEYSRFSGPFGGGDEAAIWGAVALSFVLFFGAVLIHESAHAVVARSFGLPVSGITLVLWGGYTETRSNAKGPLRELLVSAAGPASTLVVAAVLWMIGRGMDPGMMRTVVRELAGLNLIFAIVNALPGFPLDGGRMLLATTWGLTGKRRTGMRVAGVVGTLVGFGFFAFAANGLANGNTGWIFPMFLLGSILVGAGRGMPGRIKLRDQLADGRVRDVMRPPPDAIPASMPLGEALARWLGQTEGRTFPVTDAGLVVGTITSEHARRVGARGPARSVGDAMVSLHEISVLAPEDGLDDAAEWLAGREGLVLRGGALVGSIGSNDLDRWYRLRYDPAAVPARPDL